MALSILMSLSLTRRIRLSGRNIEDMLANTRDLDGQTDKRNPDFAFGKAEPQHIMRWPSHGVKDSWLAFRMYGDEHKILGKSF
jgi:hypothetical protein